MRRGPSIPWVPALPNVGPPTDAEDTDQRKRFNTIGMTLVRIPAGTFQMGSRPEEDGHSDDETLHDVEIAKPFFLGRYPVTVGQFRRFVQDRDYQRARRTEPRPSEITRRLTWDHPGWRQLDGPPGGLYLE